MLGVVKNGIGGRHKVLGEGRIFPCVQISVEPGEIAAGNLQPQRVALQKHVARGPQVNGELVDLPRIHQVRFLRRIAIAGADNSLRQILRESIRAHIHQFGGEVGVYG